MRRIWCRVKAPVRLLAGAAPPTIRTELKPRANSAPAPPPPRLCGSNPPVRIRRAPADGQRRRCDRQGGCGGWCLAGRSPARPGRSPRGRRFGVTTDIFIGEHHVGGLHLAFIGVKILIERFYPIPIAASLGVLAGVLLMTALASVMFPEKKKEPAGWNTEPQGGGDGGGGSALGLWHLSAPSAASVASPKTGGKLDTTGFGDPDRSGPPLGRCPIVGGGAPPFENWAQDHLRSGNPV